MSERAGLVVLILLAALAFAATIAYTLGWQGFPFPV